MCIDRSVNRVPGGLLVVPLLIGMVINTASPNLLKISGFTQALGGSGVAGAATSGTATDEPGSLTPGESSTRIAGRIPHPGTLAPWHPGTLGP